MRATCLEKYGVEYPIQNAEIAKKTITALYLRKNYTLPSGKIIQIQGYESFAIDELLQTIDENEIITGITNVPEIWYVDDEGIKHRHYVDIFIPSQNKCIEVKSSWTFQMKNVLIKQKAGKQYGYNYEIWVYNKKGEIIEYII